MRLGDGGADNDATFAAMGKVLTASGGRVHVALISTAAVDLLGVDDLGCTTANPGACIAALPALRDLQPAPPTANSADDIMSGATWRAATFLAQPVSGLRE